MDVEVAAAVYSNPRLDIEVCGRCAGGLRIVKVQPGAFFRRVDGSGFLGDGNGIDVYLPVALTGIEILKIERSLCPVGNADGSYPSVSQLIGCRLDFDDIGS
ncbi:MAG: hypothetical protein Q4F30_05400 [Akkermansia sp.]|nr:hypothetical protein [Akkermansia sp.]